jgi:1-aminocyclopropane-1-carboxylate deaminase/D-cysteine desulfhydrase-like pyridoxal-dependent ACC family enzyme
LKYSETPLIQLKNRLFDDLGLTVLVKCEYRNHPEVSGNKWWKLKYNLVDAKAEGFKKLLTFGGAFSNHIYAVAAAAKENGFESIGIIRGEETLPLNHVLAFAKSCGMKLHYISREDYRKKNDSAFIAWLKEKFGNFYLIPEGGSNVLAVKGCAEWAQKLKIEVSFDYVCLPVGTGGTMAGIISGSQGEKEIIGFPVLKGAEFLEDEIKKLASEYSEKEFSNWQLNYDYHFGGYAKSTPELLSFIDQFKMDFEIPLERIYTGKMMFGVFDLVRKESFRKGSTVLVLHTGGLQSAEV